MLLPRTKKNDLYTETKYGTNVMFVASKNGFKKVKDALMEFAMKFSKKKGGKDMRRPLTPRFRGDFEELQEENRREKTRDMIRKEIKESVMKRINSMIYDKSENGVAGAGEMEPPNTTLNLPEHLLLSKEERDEMVERARKRAEEKRLKRNENLRIQKEEDARNKLRLRHERSQRMKQQGRPKLQRAYQLRDALHLSLLS